MPQHPARCWLVLGAGSSIAQGFARAAAAIGHDLLLAGRDLDNLQRSAADLSLRHGVSCGCVAFDAGDPASHADFVERVRRSVPGRLDVFLGFSGNAPQKQIDEDLVAGLTVIAATYTGAVSVLQCLTPLIEAQGGGRVVILGSVAGDRGRLKNYVYGSAKAGLHAYSQGLRARLWRTGASVTLVKPGFVDSAMTWGMPGAFLLADPNRIGAACLKAAERGREVVYLPGFWRLIMMIVRALPECVAKRLRL